MLCQCCTGDTGERRRRQKEKGLDAILAAIWASRPSEEKEQPREETVRVTLKDIETPDFSKRGLSEIVFGDEYELGSVIGRGSTSTVYTCQKKTTGKTLAVKVIGEDQLRGEYANLETQFQTEIAALRACVHPNIIHLEDAVLSDGKLYLVTELLAGGELFDYVVQKGTLSEAEAAAMLRDLTSAIVYMHDKGIVHRDLKPENLLLTSSKQIKIIDFGLSTILPEPDIQATSFLGTRGYLAPEMLKRKSYTKAVDLWALGIIAYILLCGCLPFDDDIAQLSSPLITRKFELKYPSWASKLSANAKQFLQGLLCIDPSRRLTARRAYEHAWLLPHTQIPHYVLQSPALIRNNVPKTPKLNRTSQRGGQEVVGCTTCSKEHVHSEFRHQHLLSVTRNNSF